MPFLPEAIHSLLNQSFQDFRILLIDNGSNDETSNFINNLKNEKIKYFRLDKPDLVNALNKAVEISETPFIARMDADDISHPRRFEKQINFLFDNSDIDIVGTSGDYISTNGKKRIKINLPLCHDNIIQSMLKKRNAIIHPSIMMRSKVFERYGFYDASYFPCEDYELFLRIGNKIKFANISENLYLFRVRDNSIMSKQIKESIKLYYAINEKYWNNYLNCVNSRLEPNQLIKTYEKLDILSVSIYRRGLNYLLNVNTILGIFYIIIASLVNPSRFIYSFKRRVTSLLYKIH